MMIKMERLSIAPPHSAPYASDTGLQYPVPFNLDTRSVHERHALDLAAVSEPKLHRPRSARRRIDGEEFAIDPVHLVQVRDIRQHHVHSYDALQRRAGGFQQVLYVVQGRADLLGDRPMIAPARA